MNISKQTAFWATLALGILTGCGGGGDSGSPSVQPPPSPPPTTSGITGSGLITKFGANFSTITVAGQSFNTTDGALEVTIDDQPATVSDLRVGNVVSVRASTDDNGASASASSINMQNELEGPIEAGSINLVEQTFVVLGQTVRVTASTIFDDSISPRSMDGLADGDRVEVSGLPDADGVINATRIEDDDGGLLEVRGTVSELDSAMFRFRINALIIDYSSATLSDLPGGQLENGLIVEAKGSQLDANGVLIATQVDGESPGFNSDDGDLAEIEGYITRFEGPENFDIGGLPVSASDQTQYEGGTAADLALNVRVEAKGTINANGVLVASKIEFKTGEDQANVEIAATVDSIDVAQNRIVVLGIDVELTAGTLTEDKSDADVDPFNIDDLSPGDYVEVRGFEDPIGSGQVVAVRLEREDPDDETELQGAVESVSRPSLVILGVTIDTDSSTEFESENDVLLSADQFFDRIVPGQLVKAEGQYNGNSLRADEVEFEDD